MKSRYILSNVGRPIRAMRRIWLLLGVLSSVLLTACSQGLGNKEIAEQGSYGVSLIASVGCNQFAEPGQQFANPLVVKAVDPLGGPVPGVDITFSTNQSGVSIVRPVGTSDSTGTVATNIIAPSTLGTTFVVEASIGTGKTKISCTLQTYPEQLIVISDGPTYNFETEAVGGTKTYTFTVDNTGTRNATGVSGLITDAPFSFKGGTYPGTGGTCGTLISAGQSCTLVVNFAPAAVGFYTSNIQVLYKDGTIDRTASRALQGTGANLGKIEISNGPEFDFGPVVVGVASQQTFTLQNVGTIPTSSLTAVGMTGPFQYLGGTYPGTGGTCGTTLNPAASCTVVVRFLPLTSGLHLDKIDISYYNGVSADRAERNLRGTGMTPALLNMSDAPLYDFGTVAVNSTLEHTFTITNDGSTTATSMGTGVMVAPFRFKGNVYPGTGGTCTSTLAAGATCSVVVTYAPQTSAVHTGRVRVSYNNGALTQEVGRDVQGTGADLGFLQISSGPLFDFLSKPVGSVTDQVFTVTNVGTASATSVVGTGLLPPYSFKGGAYPGTGGSCAATFAAGTSCTIVISFAPTAAGVFNDTIQLNYNDGANAQTAQRDVVGTGLSAAQLVISNAPAYDFGTRAVGSSTDFTLAVSNTGAVPATAMAGSGLSAPFSFKGGSYPGTGGTCSASLAPAGSCTVVVTFAPTSAAVFNSTMQISYNDGAVGQNASRSVQGTGSNQAVLTISNAPIFDFGTIPLNTTVEQSFVVQNTGGTNATSISGVALGAPYAFKGGSFPGTGGTCSAALAVSATCTVVVTFRPTTTGLHTATLRLDYNDGAVTQNVQRSLQGTGANDAQLMISDAPTFDFGTKAVSTSTDKIFTVNNTGGVVAAGVSGSGLSAPFSYKGGAYPGTGGTCGANVTAGSSCQIVVSFSPTTTGTFSGQIQLNYTSGATAKTATRDVTGVGATVALLTLSDAPLFDFGTRSLGSSTDKVFTVTNTGGLAATSLAAINPSGVFSFKGGTYPGIGGTCGASLSSGANCSVVVTYAPVAVGTQSNKVELAYNDGLAPQTVSRDIQGTAANAAVLAISDGPTYDFGSRPVTSSTDRTLTVSNTGSVPATSISGTAGSAPFSFKGGSFPGTGGTCAATLNASATCTLVVTFAPTATGLFTGNVQVSYQDGTTSQTSNRPLQGTGTTAAQLSISNSPALDFGPRPIGSSVDQTLTVSNSGGAAATAMAGASLTAPYSFKGGTYPGTGGTCGTTLAPATNCTLVVSFAPTATGAFNQTLTVNYNDGLGAQSATRNLTGSGVNAAFLAISDGPTFDYGTRAVGSSVDYTFTVNNTGGVGATSMAGGGLAAPFSFKGGTYPGTGGSCGANLSASASCTMVVTFAPTATGVRSGTIQLDYDNGLTTTQATRAVQGTGANAATLVIAESPSYDYGTVAVSASADHIFTVNNSGGVAATALASSGLSTPFTFKGGTYPGTGGTCASTLAAGASCQFVVTFAPTATGTHTRTLRLDFNNGVAASFTTVDVQGLGASSATLTISDAPFHDFGNLALGGSATKSFTISNTGGVAATTLSGSGLTAPFAFDGGSYPGTGGTCGATLNAGSNCSVVVRFSPTVAGLHQSTLQINYQAGSGPQSAVRDVRGTGQSAALLTLSGAPFVDFGARALTSVNEHTITLSNSGDMSATSLSSPGLSAPFAFKGGSYPGTGGNCSTTLASGGSCSLVITFTPTATGPFSDTLTINYNNGLVGASVSRGVQGIGATKANLQLSDAPTFDFGTKSIGSSTDKTLTLTNTGGVAGTALAATGLSAPFSYKGGSYPGTGGTCATTLNASASCTVVVTYAPTTTGLHTDTVSINYQDGTGAAVASRPIQGTGSNLAFLTISNGAVFDYGTRALGSSTDQTFTVQNTGGISATSMSGSGLAAPFAFKGGTYPGTGGSCTSSLAASASCTIVVTYAPTAVGTHSDTIDINFNDGSAMQVVSRDVTGQGVSPALLTISDSPLYDYGVRAVGSATDRTFTINNLGGATATAVAGSGLAAPFSFKGGAYPGVGGSCGAALAPAASCTVVVTFSPAATGSFSDAIDINYNTGAGVTTVSRNIQGTASTPASLVISNAPYDFGSRAMGSTTEFTFSVSNTGGVGATAMAGSGLAAPFEFKGGTYPGVGGTCGLTLSAGGSCSVVVTFTPSAAGVATDTMIIDYNDGAAAQSAQGALQGTGTAVAVLSFAEAPSFDFGTRAVGSSQDRTVTLSNSGALTATAMSGSALGSGFNYKGGTYPGTGGTCATTLVASASCTIVVTFSPTGTGAQSATLSMSYNNGAVTQTANLSLLGTAVSPANLVLSNSPLYNFGSRATGSSTDFTLTVNNTGGFAASAMSGQGLAAPFSFKGGSYPGTGGNCSVSLAPAGSCTIVVTYAPTTVATHSDTIEIVYDNGASSQMATRDVQGTGVLAAFLSISNASVYDYGTRARGSVSQNTFTVTNTGGVLASSMSGAAFTAPFGFVGGSYPGTGGTCSASLGIGSSCTVVVNFSPTANGIFTGNLRINYNNGTSVDFSDRGLQGTAVDPASLSISNGPTFNFGLVAVASFVDQTFTITNGGGVAASSLASTALSAPYSFVGGSYPGTGGTCAATLAVSSSCTVMVRFAPSVTGVQSQTLTLNYDDGAAAQAATRPMTGTGVNPAFIAIDSAPLYDFGERALGSVSEATLNLTNTGGVTATSMAGAALSSPFRYKGGAYPGTGGSCTATLSASASCSIIVEFVPVALGLRSDTVVINYNNGAGTQSALRTVQGIGAGAAVLTISNAPFYDFGTRAVNSQTDFTFSVQNTGSVQATSMVGTGLSGAFRYKGGTYPGTGGTCATTLDKDAICTVVVTFNPTSLAGPFSSSMVINYFDGALPQSAVRNVTGNSANAALLTVSGGPFYDYGTRGIGTSTDNTFTISNTGGVAATSLTEVGLNAPFSIKGGVWPGTGGTCSTTLNASASCTIVVTFLPAAVGLQSDAIDISYNDGAAVQSVQRNVQGTGAIRANLIISDGATYDYGSRAVGSSTDKVFNVDNTGGVPATSMAGGSIATPFRFKGGSYPGTGGTCGASLAAAGTCQIVVEFSPISTGAFSDTVRIDYNDSLNALQSTRPVVGTGANPALLSISDGPTFSFGPQAVGAVTEKTFTVSNSGGVAATSMATVALTAPFRYKGTSYPGTGGTCGSTLATSSSCTLVVEYAPSAVGTQTDTLTLNYSNGASAQSATRGLSGTATAPAVLTISNAPTYDFGTQPLGVTVEYTFTVQNTGGTQATALSGVALTSPYAFKGGSYPGAAGTCGTTLNVAATCTLVVTFSPVSAGTFNQTLRLNYNDGATSQQATRPMVGVGGSAAVLTISNGPTFNFGTRAVGSSTDQNFTVNNSGAVPATSMAGQALPAHFSYKGGSYPGTGGTCGTSLAAAGSCSIIVTYSPTATGTHNATLNLNYHDGVASQTSSRDMTGVGANAASITISDGPTYNYGTLAVGAVAERTFTLTNSGGVAATSVAAGAGLALPFRYKGGSFPGTAGTCASTLAASGGTCTIVVEFAPTATGTPSSTITVTYWDGAGSQNATRAVQGTAVTPASLTISNGPTYNFGTQAVGSNTDMTFTVTNSGGFSASTISASGLSAPMVFKGGSFPGTGGTCTSSLAAGGSCTLVVTYSPTATGVTNRTLSLSYDTGASTTSATRAMTGTGANPASLSLSASPQFDFGTRATGSSTDGTLTLSNGGGVAATAITGTGLSAPFTYKGGSYPGTGGTCGATLNASSNCTIIVTFSPTALGLQTGTATINFNNGATNSSVSRNVQGTGAATAFLTFTNAPSYDFGTVALGTSGSVMLQITNSGGVVATGLGVTGLGGQFAFSTGIYPGGGTCGTTLGVGASCTVGVTFQPTVAGPASATMNMNYNDGATNTSASINLLGNGAALAVLTISDAPTYDYGRRSVGSSTDRAFVVTNVGTVSATSMNVTGLAAPFALKGGSYPGTGGTCGATLGASSTCTIVVTFAPTAIGSYSSTMTLNYNDSVTSRTASRPMVGQAEAPASLSFSGNAFGNRAVGSSTDVTVTVQNLGGVDATSISGTGLSAPFSFKGGSYPGTGGTCGLTLAYAASCTMVVTYSPTATGSHSSTATLNYQDGTTSATATGTFTGTGVPPALVTISNGPTYDFGTRATGSSTDFTFTVSNTGGFTASPMLGSGLTSPFSFKGGFYPGTGGTCGASLSASGTCTVVVTFAPTVTGVQTSTLSISYNNGASSTSTSIDVTGTGQGPATISVSPSSFNFGTRAVGSSTDQSFNLTNLGSLPATSLASSWSSLPFRFKGGSFPGTGGNCTSTLNPASSCTIILNYAPTATGSHSATATLTFNDGVQSQNISIPLNGVAAAPASLALSNSPLYNFGVVQVGNSPNVLLTLTNSGGVAATPVFPTALLSPYSFRGGAFPGTSGTCTSTLNAASSCTIDVAYTPTSAGTHPTTLTINYFDGVNAATTSRDITGTAQSPAVLTISNEPSFDFGPKTLNSVSQQTLSVTNSGSFSATAISASGLSSPINFVGGTYPGTGGNCGATLAAGASCNIVVAFNPTSAGNFTRTLQLAYNDSVQAQTATRQILGRGAVTTFCSDKLANSPFASGAGTLGNPYTICTPAQLAQVNNYKTSHFVLRDHLDLTGFAFTPLGGVSAANEFRGSFDGNNFTISNLTYNGTNNLVGFFGEVANSAAIRNVILQGISVSGNNYVGGLVGRLTSGTVTNSYVLSGSVTGANSTAADDGVGGLVGSVASGSSVTRSGASVAVSGAYNVGGLVGLSSGQITESYATGAASASQSDAGGLVGELAANASDVFASGGVSASGGGGGGLVGRLAAATTISRGYSTGAVGGAGTLGGLVGISSGSASAAYWDTQTSGQGASAAGTGATTAQMRTQSTYSGWDFVKVWRLEGNVYPTLSLLNHSTAPVAPSALVVNERFEAAGTDESWNAAVTDSGNVFNDDALASDVNSPSGWGSQALRVALSGGSGPRAFRDRALSAMNHTWTSFQFVVTNFGTLNNHVTLVETMNSGATSSAWSARIRDVSGTRKLSVLVYHNGSANEVQWPSSGGLELNQLYSVDVNWDIDMDRWRLIVNGASVASGTLTGSAATLSIGHLIVGSQSGTSSTGTVYYMDRVRMAQPIAPANLTMNVESTITLTASDENADAPVSCSLVNLVNVTETTPCQCVASVCTVGVTGSSGYTGAARFDYRIQSNGQNSNLGSASFNIQ